MNQNNFDLKELLNSSELAKISYEPIGEEYKELKDVIESSLQFMNKISQKILPLKSEIYQINNTSKLLRNIISSIAKNFISSNIKKFSDDGNEFTSLFKSLNFSKDYTEENIISPMVKNLINMVTDRIFGRGNMSSDLTNSVKELISGDKGKNENISSSVVRNFLNIGLDKFIIDKNRKKNNFGDLSEEVIFDKRGSSRKIDNITSSSINLAMNISSMDIDSFQKSKHQIISEAALLLQRALRRC